MKRKGRYLFESFRGLALVFMIFSGSCAIGQDSTKTNTTTTLQILPRIHSSGYFPFTGALLNRNPVFDVNVFYEKKSLGFFVFQSVDLKDRHSYANYFQPGLFATWRLHPTFKVRGFFGYIFSQTNGFRDHESDYYAATTLYWEPAPHLSLQNTVLFYDYNIKRKLANRLLITLYYPKFKVDLFLWHRSVLEEKQNAISASLAATYQVKLGEKTSLQLTAAYMRYLTAYRPSFALDDGLIFTIGVPVDIRP